MDNWYTRSNRSTVDPINDTTTAAITDLTFGTPSDNNVTLEGADSDITDQLTYCYHHCP